MDPDFELEFEMVSVLRAYKATWDDGDSAAAAAATDVDLLKRAWLNEKAASDILSFDSPLALRVREQIQHLIRSSPPRLLDHVPPLPPQLWI
jgi:hypothetical protein